MVRASRCRFVGCLLGVLVGASAAPAQFSGRAVATGFSQPVFAAAAAGSPGTLFVVEKGGTVRPLDVATGTVGATPLLALTAANSQLVSQGEQGLLGLAFHPQYASNGLVYAKYTFADGSAGGGIRVEQFRATNGTVDLGTRRTVLQFNHDPQFTNHNAGWIGFNPAAFGTARQNQLFVMTGDGGGSDDPRGNGQNSGVFQAKVLRVDVAGGLAANFGYTVPADNSPAGSAAGRPEVYATGLRNPYRASFDRGTGNLFIGDVGQNSREEIDFIANGAAGGQNFGWRLREGTVPTPTPTNAPVGGPRPVGNVDPLFEYAHSAGLGQSVTGGYVYRGQAVDPATGRPLDGTYFFGDFVSGRLFSLRPAADGLSATDFQDRTTQFGFQPGQVNWASFAEDGFGQLYGVGFNGAVYLLVPVPEPGVVLGAAAVALGLFRLRRRL